MCPFAPIAAVLMALPAVAAAQQPTPATPAHEAGPTPAAETPGQAGTPATGTPATVAPAQTSAGSAQPRSVEAPADQAPQPPPLLVLVVSDAHAAPVAGAIRDAVGRRLADMVEGRPTRVLTEEAALAALAACGDPACIGAIVARAGAVAGVLVRATRRARRGPVRVQVEVVDPVSGAARGEPARGSIPGASVEDPGATLDPLLAALGPWLPAPPPRTTLLVAVNVDGSDVRVDAQPPRRSPLAPFTVAPGRHTVQVSGAGYLVQRRQVDLAAGEAARIDFDLGPDPDTAERDAQLLAGEQGASASATPWYLRWYSLAAAGAILVGVIVIVAVAATSGGGGPSGIPVPPIN